MYTKQSPAHRQPADRKNTKPTHIPLDVYERHLLRAKDRGNWLIFFARYMDVMTRNEALFVCDLLNHAQMPNTATSEDGYFQCTEGYLRESRCRWTGKEQEGLLKSLQAKGFILTARRGLPARRWMRVDVLAIETALDAAEVLKSESFQSAPERADWVARSGAGKEDFPSGSLLSPKETLSAPPTHAPSERSPGRADGPKKPIRVDGKVPVTQGKVSRLPSATNNIPAPGGNGAAAYSGKGTVRPAPDQQGNMPLNPDLEPKTPPQSKYLPEDYRWATKLRDALAKKGLLVKNVNTAKWATTFATMRLFDEVSPEDIDVVLHWYCNNCGAEYVPQCLSAKSFREKFAAVRESIERKKRDRAKAAPEVVSPAAQKVAAELKSLHWPKGAAAQLPGAVQKTMDTHAAVLAARKKFEAAGVGGRLGLFHKNLWFPSRAGDFAREWFRRAFARVKDWKDWSGNLTAMAFHDGAEEFAKWGRGEAQKYCGDPTLWDRYVAKLKEVAGDDAGRKDP